MAGCIRRAWLALDGATILLEDASSGYFCTSLDLGYPEVREVISHRPDADGADDRTQFFGARVVSANVTALAGAGAVIDDVASRFERFMRPSSRGELHYVLDRPGAAERMVNVRPAGYTWAVTGPDQRDVQMQWTAADPFIYDPRPNVRAAWAGATASPGRAYDLKPNRLYPPGGGGGTVAQLSSPGDAPAFPVYRVYGPITAAEVRVQIARPDGSWLLQPFGFKSSYIIGAGRWVDIDSRAHTVTLDDGTSQLSYVNWQRAAAWPYIETLPSTATMWVVGNNTSGVTQVQATWYDTYLS